MANKSLHRIALLALLVAAPLAAHGKDQVPQWVRDAAAQKLPPVQLYDMTADIGEKSNIQFDHTEMIDRLTRLLEKYVADGRSTPGTPQKNDVPIELWKDRNYTAKSGNAD